ncbi:MAG: hypothetical protein NC548_43070 [Lachnospiraceae bacterium]|nr:hypothetical protein [Lachnospiraceae bacterium]
MANELKSVMVTDIVLNADNPREITDDKMALLVQSLLVFPKMLALRPVVIDAATHVVYGGNMRTKALLLIQAMTQQEILANLQQQTKYNRLTEFEQQELQEYWAKWQKRPLVKVQLVSDLTEAEKAEFVIKDNVGFGKWDFDKLANEWDNDLLAEMGMDIWHNTDANIDDFFTDNDSNQQKGKELHVLVHIPDELEAEVDEIRQVVEAAVSEYAGVTVK